MSDVTRILNSDDPQAAEELLPLVYSELRKIAAVKMGGQAPGQTLQSTALVHEAYMKLVGGDRGQWNDSRHFFCAAAEAMRHILIDRARRKIAQRRHRQPVDMPIDELDIAIPEKEETLIQLDEAFTRLASSSPELAEIVRLRFFAGFKEKEVAAILDISERTVQRQWAYARTKLFEMIQNPSEKGNT